MKYLSLFTGIGGFDMGFDRAGMKCIGQVEMDKSCNHVLRRHWPDVKRIKDVRNVTADTFQRPDVICGGFPCQDLSVAGKRAGLAGERSGLWSEFARIVDIYKPGIVVIENVPGLLSSNAGRDMAVILRWLGDNGYRWAYRILDSQYFGVAQRRRRVFIVASLGNASCVQILFESEGLRRNPAEGREEGESSAADVARSLGSHKSGGGGNDLDGQGAFIPDVCGSVEDGTGRETPTAPTLVAARESGQGYWMEDDKTGPIRCEGENRPSRPSQIVALWTANTNANGHGIAEDRAHTLDGAQGQAIAFSNRGNETGGLAETIRSDPHGAHPCVCYFGIDGDVPEDQGISETVSTREGGITDTAHAVCFQQNTRDEVREVVGKVAGSLSTQPGGIVCARESGQGYWMEDDKTGPIRCEGENRPSRPSQIVAFHSRQDPITAQKGMKQQSYIAQQVDGSNKAATLRGFGHGWQGQHNTTNAVAFHFGVRRLTPTECMRLQGFPDDHCAWGLDENGSRVEISDAQQYRMAGNAVTVSVAEWTGKRAVAAGRE